MFSCAPKIMHTALETNVHAVPYGRRSSWTSDRIPANSSAILVSFLILTLRRGIDKITRSITGANIRFLQAGPRAVMLLDMPKSALRSDLDLGKCFAVLTSKFRRTSLPRLSGLLQLLEITPSCMMETT